MKSVELSRGAKIVLGGMMLTVFGHTLPLLILNPAGYLVMYSYAMIGMGAGMMLSTPYDIGLKLRYGNDGEGYKNSALLFYVLFTFFCSAWGASLGLEWTLIVPLGYGFQLGALIGHLELHGRDLVQ
jgi:hypothetical protein